MINIAIVEDNAEDVERLKNCLEYFKQNDGGDYAITEFSDAVQFMFRSSFDFDLIFLDIQMPEMNGIKAAKLIREQNRTVGIVFITNMRQLAIKGYEVDAIDFLVKPINPSDFYLKMKHILLRLDLVKANEIVIGTRNQRESVAIASVKYLEVSGHYVKYHIGESVVIEYSTLKEVERKLEPYGCFAKCSRYFLVNLNYVDRIVGDEVCLGETKLAISRSMKRQFCQAFAEFVVGR